jgi:mxaA protein
MHCVMRLIVFRVLMPMAVAMAFAMALASPSPAADTILVRQVTIQTPRDIGYFVGDLIRADITLVVDGRATLDTASLPHPGAVTYWLDVRSVDITQRADGDDRRYVLTIIYQNFYAALDARAQEIPTFPLLFHRDGEAVTFDVPAWTIGVSPLREVAPPVKSDPRDYLRPDRAAPLISLRVYLWSMALTAFAAVLCLLLVAHDRAWWPFRLRPARAFSQAAHRLRQLRNRKDETASYLQALEILHRGIDQADNRSVLADDLDQFLQRHAAYRTLRASLGGFFAASRLAFFANDPERARGAFSFDMLEALARNLAGAERSGA